jgi:hypothetical protein
LDFAKAYDKVSWEFFSWLWKRWAWQETFIGMVRLLLENVMVLICLNHNITKALEMREELSKGAHWAPNYLSL